MNDSLYTSDKDRIIYVYSSLYVGISFKYDKNMKRLGIKTSSRIRYQHVRILSDSQRYLIARTTLQTKYYMNTAASTL